MDAKVIGKNVKFFRKERKLTQSALAAKVAMTQQNVARIEKGAVLPPIDTLEALAKALGVSLLELYLDAEAEDNFIVDFTCRYRERMEQEPEDVQAIMQRALDACGGKMIVVLKLSKTEQEMHKMWNGEKKDAVRFWEFLDEFGVSSALDAPVDFAWCLRKLEEFGGNVESVRKAWADKQIKKMMSEGIKFSIGLPHNINTPWLCLEDMLQYISLTWGTVRIRKKKL